MSCYLSIWKRDSQGELKLQGKSFVSQHACIRLYQHTYHIITGSKQYYEKCKKEKEEEVGSSKKNALSSHFQPAILVILQIYFGH